LPSRAWADALLGSHLHRQHSLLPLRRPQPRRRRRHGLAPPWQVLSEGVASPPSPRRPHGPGINAVFPSSHLPHPPLSAHPQVPRAHDDP
jgi:hypothetical protein